MTVRALLALVVGLSTAACVTIPHAARVQPGTFATVRAGTALVAGNQRGQDSSHDWTKQSPYAQVAVGQGYRRMLVYVAVPLAHPIYERGRDPEEPPGHHLLAGTMLGIYRQFGPLDESWTWGAGALIGLGPELYAMAGRRVGAGSLDGGVRVCAVPYSACAHAFGSFTVPVTGYLRAGLWFDAWAGDLPFDSLFGGDSDHAKRGLLGGLVLQVP